MVRRLSENIFVACPFLSLQLIHLQKLIQTISPYIYIFFIIILLKNRYFLKLIYSSGTTKIIIDGVIYLDLTNPVSKLKLIHLPKLLQTYMIPSPLFGYVLLFFSIMLICFIP